MKIIIISDTHGAVNDTVDAISACRNGCDLILHLGDVVRDFEYIKNAFPEIPFVGVLGNNDLFSHSYDKECFFNLDGLSFLICHGHQYGVKRGYETLLWHAQSRAADVVLFGHTHECYKERFGEILLFNPGSMKNGDFGIIHTHNKMIASVDFYHLDRLKRKII